MAFGRPDFPACPDRLCSGGSCRAVVYFSPVPQNRFGRSRRVLNKPHLLTEDISWDGEFIAPDGVFVAICLNGHTATGAVNNDKTTGGVYFFQCGIHDCEELDTQIPVLPQGFFDLIFKWRL